MAILVRAATWGGAVGSLAPDNPISVFVSYAHDDTDLRERLARHLSVLERHGLLTIWHDGKIVPGESWESAISERLETADIVLLLVSPSFVASEYIYSRELRRAMERHARGEAVIIPVLLRAVRYREAPFSSLEPLPVDARKHPKPVTLWRNRDQAFQQVADGVLRAIRHLEGQSSVHPPSIGPNSRHISRPDMQGLDATAPTLVAQSAERGEGPIRRTTLAPDDRTALLRLMRDSLTDPELRSIAEHYGPRGRLPRRNYAARLPGGDLDSRVEALIGDAERTRSVHVLLDSIREFRPDLDNALPDVAEEIR
jgi:hypothetical protein